MNMLRLVDWVDGAIGSRIDVLNRNDRQHGLTRADRLRRTGGVVMVIALAGVVVAGLGVEIHQAGRHSVDYLQDCLPPVPTRVERGDTPQSLVEHANPDGLSTQQLLDAEEYVRRQGTAVDAEGQGLPEAGQTLFVPVLEICA